jgi:hypothetical protein
VIARLDLAPLSDSCVPACCRHSVHAGPFDLPCLALAAVGLGTSLACLHSEEVKRKVC